MQPISNAVLKINLSAVRQNIRTCSDRLGAAAIIPVLKADAYGLGLVPLAKAMETLPEVACFAVAQVKEGLLLRESGIQKDILILGEALPAQIEAAVSANLTLTAGRVSDAEAIDRAAKLLGKTACIHLKFDTGLHRIGLEKTDFYAMTEALSQAERVRVTGAYSHFANTDDAALCKKQYASFLEACADFEASGIRIPFRHICDSAASERYPQYALDAARLGRRLAWDAPGSTDGSIREAATLQAVVLDVRSRKAGERLGYGDGITLARDAEIAVLGIGYGDGLDPRMAERNLPVLLHGKRCPMLVCFMDQTLADVTGLGVSTGDTATLLGFDETGAFLSGQAQALLAGANEGCALTTALTGRVERVYEK